MNPITQRLLNIENTTALVKKLKKKISYKRLILHIMSVIEVTRRVAMEYIELACYELDLEKEDFK